MIRGLFTGIAAFALMTGAAFAQDSYSTTRTTTTTQSTDDSPPPAADQGPGPDEGAYRYRDRYHDHDPGGHALTGGVAGAGLGAAIGCIVTIPIGCAPGAAIGAAVGGGTGAIAGAASTPRD